MNYYIEKISLNDAYDIIKENDLNINEPVDYTIGLFINHKLVATGSLYINIIKLVSIKKDYQQDNLLSLIITNLITELTKRGYDKYFIYTKSNLDKYFISLGFKLIVSFGGISYLENSTYSLEERLNDLKDTLNLNNTSVGAILMNCNPITKGHLYLIEKASKNHETIIVFLVEEDKSYFPYEVREKFVKKATKHLKNVIVVPSTKYLISSLTFPTYFLKDLNDASLIQMNLDVLIFINYFMPIFNINKRYVGSEETDPFTEEYNKVLKSYLNEKLEIINRLKVDDTVISASLVRKYLSLGEFDKVKKLTPKEIHEDLLNYEAKKDATINTT